MAKSKGPEVIALSSDQLDHLLVTLAGLLPAATYQLVETLLRTLQWVMGALEEKKTSLFRLRRMIFGAQTEKTRNLLAPIGTGPTEARSEDPRIPGQGHGRKAAQDYPGAKRRPVPHPKLRVGDLCPKCLKGKLYLLSIPARIVRLVAQPIFSATVFELERLRCALCGALFTAPTPPEAGTNKYDPSVGVMLSLLRYGVGQPMYRTDQWQNYFGVPLAASTQWELMAAAAATPAVVYQALREVAAQGHLLHNDDTPMRVQSLRQEISGAQNPDQRTGIFTTSIIAQVDQVRVALFFTGQQHAGENLNQLLQGRAANLGQPLLMCDALEQKRVEPNSGLGEAINYMLKRWTTLTRFLSVPGAPLDNNITERALKTAILHRKNSLTYKTLRGARVGDIHMSLIHTCELNGVNPFDYLMTLQQNAEAVAKDSAGWFPWNYRQAIDAANSG